MDLISKYLDKRAEIVAVDVLQVFAAKKRNQPYVVGRTVYNGSQKLITSKKLLANFNSLGVWYSDNPEYAKSFGTLREYELPDSGQYLEVDGADFRFLYYADIYEKVYGKLANQIAQNYYFKEKLGKGLDEEDFEEAVEALEEISTYKATGSSVERLVELSMAYSQKYLSLVKKYLANRGYEGFYFPKDKPLDGEPHNAWLVFEPNKSKVLLKKD
jgi:hypothetical protein